MRLHTQYLLFFFFNDTATTEIYTLSLHDALPIYGWRNDNGRAAALTLANRISAAASRMTGTPILKFAIYLFERRIRSEEHTSELQSHLNLVCRLLLEKKKICEHDDIQQ